jgi:hypothetical protein
LHLPFVHAFAAITVPLKDHVLFPFGDGAEQVECVVAMPLQAESIRRQAPFLRG